MNSKIAKIFDKIKLLFTDKIDVYREIEVTSEIGDIVVKSEKIYSDIDGRGDPWTKDDVPITDEIEEDKGILPILVFTSVDYKIHKGDWIVVKRLGGSNELLAIYQGKANECQIYPSHQEILIKHKESAER